MTCTGCGRANRAGARFCGGCGASLASRCPACGATNEPDARFCDACGTALATGAPEPAADSVARKVVTIVFADLIGSTALHESLDPESVSRVMEAYHAAVRVPIEAHGGRVVQLLGDGVMCAFGVPQVAEDDALRAVRAGVAVQESFRAFLAERPELAGKVGLRVAVNTGEVVVSDDYAAGIGDPLNVAARLQQEARDGDVLIGEATQRHVREQVTLAQVGSFALKGRAEPVAAWRVVSLERPAGAAALPFVGREDELRRLQAVYDAAASGPAPAARLVVLLGSPGLGKSRLVAEWVGRLESRAMLLSARCESGRGATFAPLAAALRERLGARGEPAAEIEALLPADEPERARIAAGVAALLAGQPSVPQEVFFVVRRFLSALARTKPVLLTIDDLHWAEPLLLDLVEHLVQWGAGVRLLVLAAARPELRALRSSLATPGPLASDVVTLSGLDAAAATRLAARVIGADALPAAIAGRVLAASEGNPLFLAELVRMLASDGVLRREGEQWVAADASADFPMPPSIQALLAARIERLAPEQRTLLERASIVGRRFSRSALAELLPREVGDLDARLESLRRSELIEPDSGWLLGEPALRFHHALIRDAAYRRVLKNTRAELHARIAGWTEERAGGAVEHDETIGWHWEQAHQNLRELGPLDERGREFGARAARHLGAAGQRALARDDLPLAAGLLGRALERLAPESPGRIELLLDHCEALLATGEVTAASHAVLELGRLASGSERLHAWHTCFAGQLAALIDPDALRATAEASAAAAETLAAAGDAAGEAKAHSVHAGALARLGAIGACEAALDRALAAARRAGDRRRANAVLAGAPLAALFGPSPVTRASGRCLDVVRVLRITQGAPAVEAVALRCQAVLEALRGRLDAARRMVAASRRLVEELGIGQQLLESDVFAGQIEWLAGDAVAAERWLRDAYGRLRQRGLRIDAARAAAQLGRILLAQGSAAEAETLSHESEALAGDDLQAAIAWRCVRAEALAQRGEHGPAIELAKSAVEIASATDALLHHADARLALAAVLAAAGRVAEAAQEEARALELLEAKGATLLVEQTRRTGGAASRSASAEAAGGRPRATRRRVERNDATLLMQRVDEAVAARDVDRVRAHLREDAQVLDRVHGSSYGSDTLLERFRWTIERSAGLAFANQPIAVLGASLALADWREAGSEAAAGDLAVGSYEVGGVVLIEADSEVRLVRVERFGDGKLGDAIARLFARHAELLPEGPERTHAEATARSVSVMLAPQFDPDRYSTVFAPAVEALDHRTLGTHDGSGATALQEAFRAWLALADDANVRSEDVLDLAPDALLERITFSGVDRTSGGMFERRFIRLLVFGGDGSLIRIEWFDADRDAEALARFAALTAGAPPPPRRRMRENAATRAAARILAAARRRDLEAITSLIGDDFELLHHPTGGTVDRDAGLARWRLLLQAEGLAISNEPVAVLGDSLALSRDLTSFDELAQDELVFGASRSSYVNLAEVNERGQAVRMEVFAEDRLGHAVARLFERYGELLPDGPERRRTEGAARTLAAFAVANPERIAESLAADCTYIDHRPLGFPALRGAEALQGFVRSMHDAADDVSFQVEDVLGLRPDAVLIRSLNTGTERASGGAFERGLLQLRVFDADGRVVRWEQFDLAQVDEALARFDELAAPELPALRRRVRPNAATANVARIQAAVAAREVDELAGLHERGFESLHHPTETRFDREGTVATLRWMVRSGASFRLEPLATLGDALALFHQRVASPASGNPRFEVGAFEIDLFVIHEAEEAGCARRTEAFASDRLGDAVARLYERYAERLPESPERERAAATARAAAAWLGPFDPERYASAYAADIEAVDRRVLGSWSARGAAAVLRNFRSLQEVARDIVLTDELLALGPQATLVRRTHRGTELASGGAYEREFLMLHVYGPEGLVTRIEWFDAGAEALAFARFDVAAAEQPAVRFENAVTRSEEVFARLWHAGDWAAWAALTPPGFRSIDRRPLMHLEVDGETMLRGIRPFFEMGAERASQLLATRGERLALFRMQLRTSDTAEGPSEVEFTQAIEVDERGRRVAAIAFGSDDLDAAHAELDARYVAGEGAAYAALLSGLEEFRRALAAGDRDALARILPADFEVKSHRRFANVGQTLSREAYVANLGLYDELGVRGEFRVRHLRVSARALILDASLHGTREGGDFEQPFLLVARHDGRRMQLWELFDREQTDAALARYTELSSAPAAPRFGNAATRAADRLHEASRARDIERFAAELAPGFRHVDRRPLVGVDADRSGYVESLRPVLELASRLDVTADVLATRGERLALQRVGVTHQQVDTGMSELEFLQIFEADASGRIAAGFVFAHPDGLDEAHRELDRLYFAGEAAAHPRAAATMRVFIGAFARRDWDTLGALFAEDVVVRDQRRLGWEPLSGRHAYVDSLRSLVELAPDVRLRIDHARLSARGAFWMASWVGTREGGAFETPWIIVSEHDAEGVVGRFDQYDVDRLDAARARFDALRPDRLRIPPNAATRLSKRLHAIFATHDAASFEALIAPALQFDDRRRGVRMSGDRETFLASAHLIRAAGSRPLRTVLATAGERLALERRLWRNEKLGTEVDTLDVIEIDTEGRLLASVVFDPDDRHAASRVMLERYAQGEGARSLPPEAFAGLRAMNDHDTARLRALLPAEFVVHDHRRVGFGRLEGAAAFVDSVAALFELAPELTFETLYSVAAEAHAELVMAHMFGKLASGGAVESYYVRLSHFRDGRASGMELFEPEDLERARARFDELRPARRAGYAVERARPEDLPKLARVELAANVLFEGTPVAAAVAGDVTALEEHARAQAAGLLWVARAPDSEPVGFALVEILDGQPHLEEMDVDPAHGRRGLGSALLEAVLGWARGAGYEAVTLTTFRDIPWNAPFYERMGFRGLAPHEIGSGLAEVVREEAARGLDPATRVAMRCDLNEAP